MQTAVTVLFEHDERDGAGLPGLVTTLVNDAKGLGLRCVEHEVGPKWWEDVEVATDEPEQAATLTVDFASARAAELADEADLTDADFEGVEPSGSGGYTAGDVRGIVG